MFKQQLVFIFLKLIFWGMVFCVCIPGISFSNVANLGNTNTAQLELKKNTTIFQSLNEKQNNQSLWLRFEDSGMEEVVEYLLYLLIGSLMMLYSRELAAFYPFAKWTPWFKLSPFVVRVRQIAFLLAGFILAVFGLVSFLKEVR